MTPLQPLHESDITSSDIIVRQSTINQLEWCAARVGYSQDEGFLPAFSEQLVFGTVFHTYAEKILQGGKPLELVNPQEIADTLQDTIENEYQQPYDLLSNEDVDKFVEEMQVAVATLHHDWLGPWLQQEPELIFIEEELYAVLGYTKEGTRVVLRGTPDVIAKIHDPIGLDWKTAGRGWKESKAHFTIQAPLYTALVEAHKKIKLPDWEFIIYNRQKKMIETHPTHRTPKQIEAAVRNALRWGEQIEAQAFPASPTVTEYFVDKRAWYCSAKYCGAWNICEFKYINDNKSEKTKAKISWK